VADHRQRDDRRVDDVGRALNAVLELLDSHCTVAIERSARALERVAVLVHRY
jgi:hypothetical protein